MYQVDFVRQILNFQKTAFDTIYQASVLAQEGAEIVSDILYQQANWIPSENKRVLDQWSGAVKMGQKDFKRAVDQNFDAIKKALDVA